MSKPDIRFLFRNPRRLRAKDTIPGTEVDDLLVGLPRETAQKVRQKLNYDQLRP